MLTIRGCSQSDMDTPGNVRRAQLFQWDRRFIAHLRAILAIWSLWYNWIHVLLISSRSCTVEQRDGTPSLLPCYLITDTLDTYRAGPGLVMRVFQKII
jgi:hypothetical protein